MEKNINNEFKKIGLKKEITPELEREYEKYVDEIISILKLPLDNEEYMWDKTVSKYAEKVEKVKRLLQQEGIQEQFSKKIIQDLDLFLSRCRDKDFHIALVGTIKAGKSTLINALLGVEIASTDVTPETASLTKFRHCSTGNYIKISFYSTEEWNGLWKSAVESKAEVFMEEYEELNADTVKTEWLDAKDVTINNMELNELKREIKKWTSSKYATHYFVKEVEVGLKNFLMQDGIVLVDTPGLDDVVEYRSDITRSYINRANAVLVCVKCDALTGGELSTILSVFSNTRHCPEKVYTIATQLDSFNRPIDDWKKQSEEWIKYLKGKGAYGSQQLAFNNLIGTSAYLYTLLRNIENLTEDEDDELYGIMRAKFRHRTELKKDDDMYKKTRTFTGVIQLRHKLQDEIINNFRELQVRDIVENYNICQAEMRTFMNEVKKQQVELIKLSGEDVEEIRKRRMECEMQLKEEKEEKKVLDDLLAKLHEATVERAKQLSVAMRQLCE